VRNIKFLLTLVFLRIYRKLGGSWNYFYGLLLDYQERTTKLENIINKTVSDNMKGLYDHSHGIKHLDLLKIYGLKKGSKLLDFGCGYGRTAMPAIKFLDTSGFTGVELSKRRLNLAIEWAKKEDLLIKKPKFLVVKDNLLQNIANNSIDIIWTLSVFNHMPDKELHQCLKTFKRILTPGGKIFFYFEVHALNNDNAQKNYLSKIKTFPRTEEYMSSFIKKYNYKISEMNDWKKVLLGDKKSRVRFWLLTLDR